MTQLCTSSDTHHLLLTIVLDNLRSFVSFLTSHPLHLGYLLFFSPYLLPLLSFFSPLLLSTSLLFLLLSLHSRLEGEAATAGLLDQLGSMVLATVGNVFEWEFETMGVFYKDLSLNCEVKEYPVAIFSENSEKSEILEFRCGIGDRGTSEGSSFDPENPRRIHENLGNWRTMGEFYNYCEVKEVPVEIFSENSEKSELLEFHSGIGDRVGLKGGSFETENPSRMPEVLNSWRTMADLDKHSNLNGEVKEQPIEISLENSEKSELLECHFGIGDRFTLKGESYRPEKPSTMPDKLIYSPLGRRAEHEFGALGSLQRNGSMRTTGEFYKHSNLNCEVKADPVELSLENSKECEILESNSVIGDQVTSKGGRFKPENPSRVSELLLNSPSMRRTEHQGRALESLQRDGSMRKEKEWKRTLACKLYEERMTFKLCEERTVVDGAEEMDLLWEAYEVDANKADKLKNKEKNGKKEKHIKEEDGEEEEEEEGAVGQLCCLQALRLSTGKMNLGVGRPNLVKFSKAFKGIGFFHRIGRRSRKG